MPIIFFSLFCFSVFTNSASAVADKITLGSFGTGSFSTGNVSSNITEMNKLTGLTIDPPLTIINDSSKTGKIKAFVTDGNGQKTDVTTGATFLSEDPAIAEVAPDGTISPKAQFGPTDGSKETVIKVKYNDKMGYAGVRVDSTTCSMSVKSIKMPFGTISLSRPKPDRITTEEIMQNGGLSVELCTSLDVTGAYIGQNLSWPPKSQQYISTNNITDSSGNGAGGTHTLTITFPPTDADSALMPGDYDLVLAYGSGKSAAVYPVKNALTILNTNCAAIWPDGLTSSTNTTPINFIQGKGYGNQQQFIDDAKKIASGLKSSSYSAWSYDPQCTNGDGGASVYLDADNSSPICQQEGALVGTDLANDRMTICMKKGGDTEPIVDKNIGLLNNL